MAKSKAAVLDEDELELVKGADQPDPPKEDEDDDDEPVSEEPKLAEDTEPGEIEPGEPASETVGEPADTTGGGGSDDVAVVPEGVQPAPAGDDKPPVQPLKPHLSSAAQRLAEIETEIIAEDFDPYTVAGRKLQLEHNRLAGQVAAEPLVVNQFWVSESVTHSLPRNDLENIWKGITAQYEKDYPGTHPDYWQIAAKKDYDAAVAAKKSQRKPADPKPAPKPTVAAPTPITPKGARVAPPAAAVPPPPRTMSDEEELVDSVRRESKSGVRV